MKQIAEGIKGHLIFDFNSNTFVFRVRNDNGSFVDFDIKAYDVKIELQDPYLVLDRDEKTLDYKNRKSGKT